MLGKCPCCFHKARKLWFSNVGIRLFRCKTCSVVYQDPQPTLKALLAHSYNDEYFAHTKKFAGPKEHTFSQRLDDIEKHVQSNKSKTKPLRILDVGSGMGAFLVAAKRRGFEPYGIEPAPYAADYCTKQLGLIVHNGTLADFHCPPHIFDIIHFNHVLEHSQSPYKDLRRAHSLLHPHGLLVVEVPREGKIASMLLSKAAAFRSVSKQTRPAFLAVHTCVFTSTSLRELVEHAGFHIDRSQVIGLAGTWERFEENFGSSPPLGRLLGYVALASKADILAGLGNIVVYAHAVQDKPLWGQK